MALRPYHRRFGPMGFERVSKSRTAASKHTNQAFDVVRSRRTQRRGDVRQTIHSIIADRAEARIRSGAWAPGTRLPPERELCELLDVSRASLRQALAELEERGLITRHQGRGTFVTRLRFDADASGYFSVGDALRSRGLTLTTRVLSSTVIEANERMAGELGVAVERRSSGSSASDRPTPSRSSSRSRTSDSTSCPASTGSISRSAPSMTFCARTTGDTSRRPRRPSNL